MELPRRYGHYVLLERIAVGGMGEIFRAKYAGLAGFERVCAIKRILPHLSDDPEFVDRLIAEAMIAVQLSHANIVQVYELGKIESEYFIAMEWVDGPDLSTLQVRAKARGEPMPLAIAVHVVHEVARAVDHAHRKTDTEGRVLQIVHRDISPQNVLLTLDGAVKLGDFGIARAEGIARRFATGMGAVLGKRRYMSPEQRRGESVDARSDIYSLGALLHECVTGTAPDPDRPIPLLSSLVPDVPADLDALAAGALAAHPAERIPAASELVDGLERVFVRMAAAPGGVRDPGPELGRYVRRVCPPGEKPAPPLSLTARMRAAMGPGFSTGVSGTREVTEAPETAPVVEVAFDPPDGADGVTLVRSAVIPANPASAPTVGGPEASPTAEPTLTAARPAPSIDATILQAVPRAAPSREVTQPEAFRPGDPARGPNAASAPGAGEDEAGLATTLTAKPERGETVSVPARPAPGSRRPSPFGRAAIAPPTAREVGDRPEAVTFAEPRTQEALFPPGRRREVPHAAILAAGGTGVAVALALAAAWSAGLFRTEVAPPPTPYATPSPSPTAAPPQTHVAAASTRTPERAATMPTPTPAPERTPVAARTRAVASATTLVPTATPRPAYGTLVVNAKPWARVTVDGRDVGQTPIKGLRLAPGTYRVALAHPSHGRVERIVTIRGDAVEKLILDFKNPPGGPGSP